MYYLSIDQGTTSSRAIVFDHHFEAIATHQISIRQYFPKPDWVEHDALEIWNTQLTCCREAIKQSKINPSQISGIGITNQRETIVAWDISTGKPIYHAIVWQDGRTAADCINDEKNKGSDWLKHKTGLVWDAYFSASKMRWIVTNIPEASTLDQRGTLAMGTIDTWLIWQLTDGKCFYTDTSNASRTNLMNLQTLDWDNELLNHFCIKREWLPKIIPSGSNFGNTKILGGQIPILAVAGDQQAALFGHRCFGRGSAKNTLGTGCFILQNVGTSPIIPTEGLLSTVAWTLDGKTSYALEGSVFNAGSAIQWMRDHLNLFTTYDELEKLATSISSTEGVYVVPAFTGLGTPYWDMYARGTIIGLSRKSNKAHILRATLESIAYQSRDVLDTMQRVSEVKISDLGVDGGASSSHYLLQAMADILGKPVRKSKMQECTALGVALMCSAVLGNDIFSSSAKESKLIEKSYFPKISYKESEKLYQKWKIAVERSQNWAS